MIIILYLFMSLKTILKEILEIVFIMMVVFIIIIPIRMFLISPFIVSGTSMEPTFSHADYLIVEKVSNEIKRGDVVVVKKGSTHFLKRVVALPGEMIKIKKGDIIIISNNQRYILIEKFIKEGRAMQDMNKQILAKDQFFVMGDNRNYSFDSRNWGPIQRNEIIGIVWIQLFPFGEIEVFNFNQKIELNKSIN